jgi:hypothetical protein
LIFLAQLQEVNSSLYVNLLIEHRVLNGSSHPCPRCQVNDFVDAVAMKDRL